MPVYDVTTEYTFHYLLPYLITPVMFALVLPILSAKMRLALIIKSEIPEYDRELIEIGKPRLTIQESP